MSRQSCSLLQRRAIMKLLAGWPFLAYPGLPAYPDETLRSDRSASANSGLVPERVIRSASDAVDVFDFEVVARKTLPPAHFDYVAAGADGGATIRANLDGIARVALRPRRLIDVTQVDTSIELFGKSWKTPIILAPTGSEAAFHAEGAIGAAKAARSRGHLQILSTVSTSSIEEVAEATGSPPWFQIYPTTRWAVTEALLKRAAAAGCSAVAVTVDIPAGHLVRDVIRRARYSDSRQCLDCHVPTMEGYIRRKPMLSGLDLSGLKTILAPQLTWELIDRIKVSTDMKVVLKGIVTREDAQSCLEHRIDGIIVSNHGGRSDGGGRATIACLPEIIAAVEGKIPVLIDSGFRRGSDIFKALALGARAVCIGRPYLWGLASFGQSGVEAVLDILREDLELTMKQCGTPSIQDIKPAHLQVS
jgi:4-hydroxymandelate oxidase